MLCRIRSDVTIILADQFQIETVAPLCLAHIVRDVCRQSRQVYHFKRVPLHYRKIEHQD